MKWRHSIENPLLEVLVLYTRHYHRPFTKETLIRGLPTPPGQKTPELFSENNPRSLFKRAAHHAGLKSHLFEKSLDDISDLVLPVILILNKKQACILSVIDHKKNQAEIIVPNGSKQIVSLNNLKKAYTGKLFFIKKRMVNKFLSRHESQKQGHWFWDVVLLSRSIYSDAIIASLLLNMFMLGTPLFIMNVYDRVVPNNSFDTLWMFSIGIVILYLFEMVIKILRTAFLDLSAKKTDIIISSDIFEKVMDMRMQNRPKSIGAFSNTIKDFDYLRNFLANTTIAILVDIPFLFIFLFVMYFIAGKVVFIPIVTMAIMAIYLTFKRHSLKEHIKENRNAGAMKHGVLVENLNALETVKTLNLQNSIQYEWEEAVGENAQRSYEYKKKSSSMHAIIQLLARLNIIAVIISGVYLISQNEMTIGGLFAFILLSRRAIGPIGMLAGIAQGYYQAKTSFKQIDKLMKLDVEHPNSHNFIQKKDFDGKIEFRNVSFNYKDDPKEVLHDISFTINPGEKVAFLGEMGSGKTTALKLILGLYEPQSGSIYIDDLELKQINPSNIRKNIGYISQEIVLFHGTLKDNIIIKNPEADDTRILKACHYSGVDEIIKKHPHGFDMAISERGDNLSQGQRQSVGIARALIDEHPIYLMDEPTSAFDSKHEKQLITKLKDATKDSTLILITQRLSLLSMVDRIIVFQNGRIYADDTKENILKMLE